jgi:hypothetical protein
MNHGEMVLLRCRISRGGFSGERVFRIPQADSSEEHIGAASVDYCSHIDRTPIEFEEPAKGDRIDGLVEARVIENGGDTVIVALPDGETIRTKTDQVAYRPKADYVPIR